MPIRRRFPGQPANLSARELNRIADAANANMQRVADINAAAGKAVQFCYVKNSLSGSQNLRAWEVCAGHVPLYSYDSSNPGQFRQQIVVTGRWPTITPGAAADSINDHYHPVVCLHRIASGDFGLGVMSGLTPAKVSIGSEAHPCVALNFAQSDNATITSTAVAFKTASHGYRIVAKTNGVAMFIVDLSHPIGLCWSSKHTTGQHSMGGYGAYETVNPWSTIEYNSGELIRRQLTAPARGYYRQPGMYRVDYMGTFNLSYTLNGQVECFLRTTSSKDPGRASSLSVTNATGFGSTAYCHVQGTYFEEILDTSAAYIELQARVDRSTASISAAVDNPVVLVTRMA